MINKIFKFVVALCLVLLTIAAFGFLKEYRSSNMTDAQIQYQIEQKKVKAERAAERREVRAQEAREFIDNMMGPYPQDDSAAKYDWWFGWVSVLLILISAIPACYGAYRDITDYRHYE